VAYVDTLVIVESSEQANLIAVYKHCSPLRENRKNRSTIDIEDLYRVPYPVT